jgi:lipopolysaccharide transport system permease protein
MTDREIVIESGAKPIKYWQDLWAYRELFYFLAWRDVAVRYKQTVIGIAWSVIRPLLTMSVFTVVFGNIAKLPSDGIPYPILVFSALLPWQFFANSLVESSNSIIANAGMISKVYFPRLIIPSSSIIVGLVDFLISLVLMFIFMVFYRFTPSWEILTLPALMFFAGMLALGAGLWFSALNVKYRDIRHIVPFIVQFGLYISPVGFSSSVVPEKWKMLFYLNPMSGVIDSFRWALLGGKTDVFIPGVVLSAAVALLIFISGLWFFRRVERTFADII